MKRHLHFFSWLIYALVALFSFQSGYAFPPIDNPAARRASFPGRPTLVIKSYHKPQRLSVSPKNRPTADPIRFTLTCNKPQIAVGELIELTITAQLLDIPANLMFFLPGATGYSLKLLSPEGFQQTESDLSELVRGELAYPARTTATYRVRGYFVAAADRTCFRLLRGSKQATDQSLFEAKAALCLTTEPKPLSLSSPRARTGSGPQASDPAPQLHVRSPLTSVGEHSAILANNTVSGCTDFTPVCSGNNQEIRSVTINVPTAGNYPLTIGYRSPEGDVEGILRINNVSQRLRFSQTNAYATVTVASVQLNAGDNTIGLSSGVGVNAGKGYLCFNSVCVGGGSSGGCTPPAAPTLSATTTQVCANNPATLTASGCSGTVTWSTGQTGSSISVSTAGTYSATCTTNGCSSSSSNPLTLVTCPTQPNQPVSSCTNFAQACSGNNQEIRSVTINVPTAGNYPLTIGYRSPEGDVEGILRINNVSQRLRFSQTNAYATVTVASVQLNAGDNTIGLSSGVSNGAGGGYLCFNSVCVSSGGGCTPPPAPTLSATTTQVCPDTPAILTASGCSGTVTWSSGQTGSSISVSTAGTYSATCTTNDCPSGSSNVLTLNTCGCTSFAPVCSGNSKEIHTVTINVPTAGRYPLTISYRSPEGPVEGTLRINNASQSLRFNQAGSFVPVTIASVPLNQGNNTIELSSGAGGGYLCFNSVCTGVRDCTPPAAPTLSASTTQVCANNPATLTASGCSGTVTWSTGQTGNSINVSTVGNYSATCTTNGCLGNPSNSLTLVTCPALPVSGCTNFAPVCSGNVQEVRTVIINVATAGSYPLTISYRSPEGAVEGILRINSASQRLRFNQASSFVPVTVASVPLNQGNNTIELSSGAGGGYLCFNSVCAGNGGGCTPPAAPTLSASTTQVCPNAPATLTASGCNGTVTWSTGLTGNSINVSAAGTYSAICTTSTGCSSGSSALLTLTNCATPITGSCSIDDYSAEINITYKP